MTSLKLEQSQVSFNQGQKLLKAKKTAEAIAAFQQAIADYPEKASYYLALGMAQAQIQQWQAAAESFQTAINLEPHNHISHHRLGDVLTRLNQHQQAIKSFQTAAALAPNFMPAYHRLGDVLQHQKQLKAAAAAYRQALTLKPEHFLSHLGLGLTLFKLKQTQAAKVSLEQALQLKSDSAIARYRLAEILIGEKNTAQAIEQLNMAIAYNPDYALAYHRLGDIYQGKGQLSQAIDLYNQAIALNPNYMWSYFNLAAALNKQNLLAEAESNYLQAIKLQPKFADAYCDLGYVQTRQGKIDRAIASFRQSSQKHIQAERPNLTIATDQTIPSPPDFFIIGAMKSGTTSMYEYIAQHPQFLPVIQKEIDFFSIRYHHGIDWYQAHFASNPASKEYFTGEGSTSYIDYPQVPQRIHQHYPNAKMIAVLRNPIDRAFSHYNHVQKYHPGKESRSFAEAVTAEIQWLNQLETPPTRAASPENSEPFAYLKYGYLFRGLYVYFLQEWMSLFRRSQFLILQSEEFYHYPAETMVQIYQFLDVPIHHLGQYPVYNVGSYNNKIDSELYQQLYQFFEPHNQKLENFLNQKFDW